MVGVLLDASALIALLNGEQGFKVTKKFIATVPCFVSSVTLTELEGKLVGMGQFTPFQVQAVLAELLPLLGEIDYDANCRRTSAFYYARRKPYHLSLGDAMCLGTAEAKGYDVLTAEKSWADIVDLPFQVHLIR